MSELTKMPNIGEKLENQLHKVGINTPEELKVIGSRDTWLRIKAIDSSACLMRLSALEGAIKGIRWHYLDTKTKEELREFYHTHK
ncbi:MAG: TfoX/Sxy family protein [Eubacteriales bacterium]